jgi:hypothetical protein
VLEPEHFSFPEPVQEQEQVTETLFLLAAQVQGQAIAAAQEQAELLQQCLSCAERWTYPYRK